jgi:hypothetical protein
VNTKNKWTNKTLKKAMDAIENVTTSSLNFISRLAFK